MKKLALAAALSMLGAGTSAAADMAVKAPPAALPIAVANWTGCYLGAGGGYGMFNQRREVIAPAGNFVTAGANPAGNIALALTAPAGAVVTPNETFGGEGWLFTGQVGCDYQFSNNWLIGAFADGDWTGLRGDHSLLGVFRGQQSMRWSWAVGGRAGLARYSLASGVCVRRLHPSRIQRRRLRRRLREHGFGSQQRPGGTCTGEHRCAGPPSGVPKV